MAKQEDIDGKVLLCFHCGNKTFMQNVVEYKNHAEDGNEEFAVWEDTIWKIYFCPVCSKVTLEETVISSEDIYEDYVPLPKILFPAITSDSDMPETVRNSFEAALKVRNIDGAICLLSLRRTLEMMCKDKGATQNNLFAKLKHLSNTGLLPPIIDKMAVVLKNLGKHGSPCG